MCQTIEKHLGKFEGEPCVTKFAYYYVMNGNGVPDERDSKYMVLKGPFSKPELYSYQKDTDQSLCSDCWFDILNAKEIYQWEDTQGFQYSKIV
mgnify:CR=1 FL=1